MELERALLRLAWHTPIRGTHQVLRIYGKILLFAVEIFLYIILGYLANLWGWMWVNYIMSLLFVGAFFGFAGEPVVLLEAALAAGIIIKPVKKLSLDAHKLLERYFTSIKHILFWIAGTFLILGSLSMEENPRAFWGAMAAVTVLALYPGEWMWGRKLMRRFAMVMLLANFLSLIPAWWINHVFGDSNLLAWFYVEPVQKEALKIKELQHQNGVRADEKILADIRAAVAAKKSLTPSQQHFLDAAAQERQPQPTQQSQTPTPGATNATLSASYASDILGAQFDAKVSEKQASNNCRSAGKGQAVIKASEPETIINRDDKPICVDVYGGDVILVGSKPGERKKAYPGEDTTRWPFAIHGAYVEKGNPQVTLKYAFME